MAKSGWGGKRENAGSGGARPGAGPKKKIWNSGGHGAVWTVERQKPGEFPKIAFTWRVVNVTDEMIEFEDINTGEGFALRKPDE